MTSSQHSFGIRGLFVGLVSAVVLGSPQAAAYDEPKLLEEFGDWAAYEQGQRKRHLCFASSKPKESKGGNRNRGEPEALITHHPGARVKDEIAFISGYLFRKGTQAEVKIGGHTFQLRVVRDGAMPGRKETAEKMLAAMKEGKTMVITGVTAWNKETTDTYSLIGFAEAYEAIGKACGKDEEKEEEEKLAAAEKAKKEAAAKAAKEGEKKALSAKPKKTGDETARKAILLPAAEPKPKKTKIEPLR